MSGEFCRLEDDAKKALLKKNAFFLYRFVYMDSDPVQQCFMHVCQG